MKKIRIFIGSSLDDLAYERRDLVSFIAGLNNKYVDEGIYIEPYICEESSNEMRQEGSQKAHDDYIKDSADATVFMFYKKAGQYTLKELDVARNALNKEGKKKHILVFFKVEDNRLADTEEIKAAEAKVSDGYAHYYKKFTHTDTIKLELLQYISSALGKSGDIGVRNGIVYVGDFVPEDISLKNVYAYQKNQLLQTLESEICALKAKIKGSEGSDKAALCKRLDAKEKEYAYLQEAIFDVLKRLFSDLHSDSSNPLRLKALSLVEEGKLEEAKKLLSLEVIQRKTKFISDRKKIIDSVIKAEARDNILNAYTRIDILSTSDVDETEEIEKTYESVFELGHIANDFKVMIMYIDNLIDNGKTGKAYAYAKQTEKYLENPSLGDLHSRFDIYNILSELAENPTEAETYESKARDSLVWYIERLDASDWRSYVNDCLSLAEYADLTADLKGASIKHLKNAISLMERLDEDCGYLLDRCKWQLNRIL